MQSRFAIAGIHSLSLTALATALLLDAGAAIAAPASSPKAGSAATVSADSKATHAPAEASDATDADDDAQPKETSDISSLTKQPPPSAIPVGEPPKPAKPEDQELRPYVPPRETVALGKERHLTLSAVAGVWWHGMNGAGASTKAGPVWGASGRVDPYRWLGIRVTVLRGNQSVTPDFGALGVANVQIQQSDFQIIHWVFRLEPTWHVNSRVALWAGPGLGWARAIAPEPRIGNLNWVTADRSCVYVDAQFALGGEYELVRDWITLNLDLSASSLGYQSGSAHDPIQAFTPDGHMTHVGGYPNFSHKVQGLFGVGIIL